MGPIPGKRYEPLKAGDRVAWNGRFGNSYTGSVVQDEMRRGKVLVKCDEANYTGFVYRYRLTKTPSENLASIIGMDFAHGPDRTVVSIVGCTGAPVNEDSTSLMFRQNPHMRRWETSYTYSVCVELADARRALEMFNLDSRAVVKANNLLKNYHRDLHIPYQQRDEARALLAAERQENVKLREQIANAQRALEHRP